MRTDAPGARVAADSSGHLARLLAARPTLQAAVLSHDSTKLYTGSPGGIFCSHYVRL